MLKKVTLYGELGEKFGKHWELDVKTPAEAIKAIEANIPGFHSYLSEEGRCFHVVRSTKYDKEELDINDLAGPLGKAELKIVPVVHGAKSGFSKFLIGVLMVVAVVYTAGMAAGMTAEIGATFGQTMSAGMGELAAVAAGEASFATGLQLGLAKMGAAIAVQGIAQMLAPKPNKPTSTTVDNGSSYNFNGPVNTTNQGVPIPLCYGRLIVGAAVISASVVSEDIGVDG